MFTFRPLTESDLSNNFAETLASLREVSLTTEEMIAIHNLRSQQGIVTYVAITDDKVVGTASLLIEQKFIRQGGRVGHIEDVAIHKDYQRQGIGRMLMELLEIEARSKGCYKIILDCHESNIPFYEKLGYSLREMQMRKDL